MFVTKRVRDVLIVKFVVGSYVQFLNFLFKNYNPNFSLSKPQFIFVTKQVRDVLIVEFHRRNYVEILYFLHKNRKLNLGFSNEKQKKDRLFRYKMQYLRHPLTHAKRHCEIRWLPLHFHSKNVLSCRENSVPKLSQRSPSAGTLAEISFHVNNKPWN